MPELMINGVPVSFPFEPYAVQRTYMEKVVECLQMSYNGVLESPTGTGKTLSLLCASLGWLLVKKAHMQISVMSAGDSESIGGLQSTLHAGVGAMKTNEQGGTWGMPKIIYASRTHGQLTQAVQELKRTTYNHVRVTVLGSRDQLCIHPEVSKETSNANKVHLCRMHVTARTCTFYNNTETKKEDPIFNSEGILDIEDLVQAGRKLQCCPYYVAKDMKTRADVIFTPYNYLLDPKTRRAHGIELLNNVVILDEAHNIEKMCEESASLQIRSTDIALCIDEVTQVMKSVAEEDMPEQGFSQSTLAENRDFGPQDLTLLKTFFLELEKAVDDIPVGVGTEGTVHPGGFIFDVLATAGLTHSKKAVVLELVDKLVAFLSTTSASPFQRKGSGLQKFADLLNVAFPGNQHTTEHVDNIKRCYKVHVSAEVIKKTGKSDNWAAAPAKAAKAAGRVLNYWCFSPGFGMQQLLAQGVRCVILTSGTLAPLGPLISELGIPIRVQLENPHVIRRNQVCIGVIGKGPDNFPLTSSFKSRNDPAYISSLGRTILNLCRVIPHGVLVFFASYPIMRKCQEDWQLSGLWTQINDIKTIFVEPQGKGGFAETMTGFYERVRDPSAAGACFMAVVRGKVSEGLDFADINGRAVIITGVPFPPFFDPRVVLKQKYLDETRGQNGAQHCLSGNEWYQLEASRAVNQAVGRVIRHADDFGAILLCDHRFGNPAFQQRLSAWLRPNVTVFPGFGVATRTVREFFRRADKDLPPPKIKLLPGGPAAVRGPVSARFEQTSFRASKQPRPAASVPQAPLEQPAKWTVSDYLGKGWVPPSEEARPLGLFEALDRPCSIIDFNANASATSTQVPGQAAISTGKAAAARSSKALVLKPVALAPLRELTCPCRGKNLDGLCSCKPANRETLHKAAILSYLKELKKSLDSADYLKFANAFREYKKSADYAEFMGKSREIFVPVESRHPLLKAFSRFIKREHIADFQVFCSSLRGCK